MSLRDQVQAFGRRAAAGRADWFGERVTILSGSTTLHLNAILTAPQFRRVQAETGWMQWRERLARVAAHSETSAQFETLQSAPPTGLVGATLTDHDGVDWRIQEVAGPTPVNPEWKLTLSTPSTGT